jgi:hypothetical protein
MTVQQQPTRQPMIDTESATPRGLVGSWRMTFFEADGSPTRMLATIGADGTLVTAEHPVVTPPIAPGVVFTSSGHGAWVATGPNTASFTVVGLGSLGEGTLLGAGTAQGTITLNSDGHAFSGDVLWTITDPAGNVLAAFPGQLAGTRIVATVPADGRTGRFPDHPR